MAGMRYRACAAGRVWVAAAVEIERTDGGELGPGRQQPRNWPQREEGRFKQHRCEARWVTGSRSETAQLHRHRHRHRHTLNTTSGGWRVRKLSSVSYMSRARVKLMLYSCTGTGMQVGGAVLWSCAAAQHQQLYLHAASIHDTHCYVARLPGQPTCASRNHSLNLKQGGASHELYSTCGHTIFLRQHLKQTVLEESTFTSESSLLRTSNKRGPNAVAVMSGACETVRGKCG
jgi:hypothetical protein